MKKSAQFRRSCKPGAIGSKALGPLGLLPGKWEGKGTGWNMIALPFDGARFKFRILMNQYDEELVFTTVSDNVENRGLKGVLDSSNNPPGSPDDDQFVVALDYQQSITQGKAEDNPDSGGLAGVIGKPIHHEPGLWLYMKNLRAIDKDITDTPDGGIKMADAVIEVARLAAVPHGNSVLALGTATTEKGMPDIPPVSGLPIGQFQDLSTPDSNFLTDPYLAPYKHYIDNPFMGDVQGIPGYPGFNPKDMHEILRFANQSIDIKRTTVLTVDTTRQNAGIVNAPFVTKQAEPASMKSTFWIQELKEKDQYGRPKLRLQYSQVVMLDFFRPREDGHPDRARWPHISINTLEKVADSAEYAD
ncbi:MAG: heme-binding protein [Nitrospirales bacterium]|nr:hypothetical protein [Nitrospira sp.]MDR4499967.1 heme-binding protein [Nitrospirales bacterium]